MRLIKASLKEHFEWLKRWGSEMSRLRKIYKDTGKLPAAFESRPSLPVWLDWPMQIFEDLSSSRTYTMAGAASIPFSEIASYCTLVGMTRDKTLEIARLIADIDNLYLEIFKPTSK